MAGCSVALVKSAKDVLLEAAKFLDKFLEAAASAGAEFAEAARILAAADSAGAEFAEAARIFEATDSAELDFAEAAKIREAADAESAEFAEAATTFASTESADGDFPLAANGSEAESAKADFEEAAKIACPLESEDLSTASRGLSVRVARLNCMKLVASVSCDNASRQQLTGAIPASQNKQMRNEVERRLLTALMHHTGPLRSNDELFSWWSQDLGMA